MIPRMTIRALFSAAIFAFCFSTTATRAEENPESEAAMESRQYEAEEKAEQEKSGDPEMAYSSREGRLIMYSKEEIETATDKSIVGTFVCGGTVHLVRLIHDEVRKSLEKLNGRNCVLNSKLRNNGKYIYVKNVVLAGAGNAGTPRRGGL